MIEHGGNVQHNIVFILIVALAFTVESSRAQSTTQSVNVTVGAVYKISTSGNPGSLNVAGGVAGTDALTSATENSTTYNITQNFGNTVKITAGLDAVLPAGFTLRIHLASSKGTSGGTIDISNATAGSAPSVVTAIGIGADANQGITYTFSALASAGMLSTTTRTVTFTLTN